MLDYYFEHWGGKKALLFAPDPERENQVVIMAFQLSCTFPFAVFAAMNNEQMDWFHKTKDPVYKK